MNDGERHDPMSSPTGEQWAIAHGQQTAVVTEMGATLRVYSLADDEILDGFGADEWSHAGRGQVLAPWPNRLGDGRYEFGGQRIQAALNEPEHGNAIHGLVRWLPWRLEAHAQNVVSLRCSLYPTPGYPFLLELRVEYRLARDGLVVTTTAANPGPATLPFGLGFHPYLKVGTDHIDTAVLRLPARARLVVDGRGLPTGEVRPVAGTEFDFTTARAVGPTRMDTAFTALERDDDGRAVASLDHPDGGRGVDVWMDDRFSHLMCYTGDTLAAVPQRRRAISLEPMTCPPDALRSGKELVVLEPGQEWVAVWGVSPRTDVADGPG
ncbi:MAG TPA: aldose 1-epimerase family protein [Acidimicrobiales bacterium]|nr:aldose 1-epimerase family protein [Acidimicrobiales bacterium]